MCISWPGHIRDVGGIRSQFHHVIDIVPTILEATGIRAPETINGIAQLPMNGVSLAYTWAEGGANVPSTRTTQYFEELGNRAIYHEGWVACTTPATTPWDLGLKPTPDVITGYNWELYHVAEDFSESDNLAAKMPDKLKELQDLFYAEAKKYDVLPLDNSSLARFLTPRPSPTAGRSTFTYSGELSGVPPACAPSILGRSYSIEAQLDIPDGRAEGMIVTEGGRFGGYGLYLTKGELGIGRGKVVFLHNLLGLKRTLWVGPELETGKHTVKFDFKYDGPGFGKGGTGTLSVDGEVVDTKSLENTEPIMFPEDESFDVGMDTRTPIALIEHHYECPFKFTGKIEKLTFTLGPHQFVAADGGNK
jgi:arylsulfatase